MSGIFGDDRAPVNRSRPTSARGATDSSVPGGIFAAAPPAARRTEATKTSLNGGIFGAEAQAPARTRPPTTPRDSGIFDAPSAGFETTRNDTKDAGRLDPSRCTVAGMKMAGGAEPLRPRADPNRSCVEGGVFGGAPPTAPIKSARGTNARNTTSFAF